MKRTAIFSMILAAGISFGAGLQEDSLTLTWNRQGVTGICDSNHVYFSGVPYILTNCQALLGVSTQDLTGCGIFVRVGDANTNLAFVGAPQSATDGTWSCAFMIPTPAPMYRQSQLVAGIQFMLTNGTATVIDRETKQLNYQVPLH